MTSRSFPSSNKGYGGITLPQPFLLKPVGKDYLWGGSRLNDDFSKHIDLMPLAETWECSTHPDGQSIVASGEHTGKTLVQVLAEHPEYLGTHPKPGKELPILIKLIDAKQELSIQVHPTDEYAFEHENGGCGKTEFWYVLDAVQNAQIVYGFVRDMDRETVRRSAVEGTLERYLQKIPVKKDDLFYVRAGTVHAIGAGVLLAEIQQNSNQTYRLYDFDRVDKNGQKRELHIDKALDVVNLQRAPEPKQPLRVLRYRKGCASELLCRCKYFEVSRMLVNTERYREMVLYQTDRLSFHVLLCTDGCGALFLEEGKTLPFFRGDCIFVPADSVAVRLHGKAQFLDVRG